MNNVTALIFTALILHEFPNWTAFTILFSLIHQRIYPLYNILSINRARLCKAFSVLNYRIPIGVILIFYNEKLLLSCAHAWVLRLPHGYYTIVEQGSKNV